MIYLNKLNYFVIEYTENDVDLNRNIFFDGDMWSLEMRGTKFLKKLKCDLVKYYI